MTRADHERLLEVLRGCRSRVFLSGYQNPLYGEALAGWTRHEFDMPNHSGQGKVKQRRVECVWENPPGPTGLARPRSPGLDPGR
jgi:DNA adenine methylase